MGLFSRVFVPRSIRRAIHPVRTVKRAATPKSIKKARRALHPMSNAVYQAERSLNTKPRRRQPTKPVYHHGSCSINHRTPEAAAKCRKG